MRWRGPTRAPWGIVLGALLALTGCDAGVDVDGVWQTREDAPATSLDFIEEGYQGNLQFALGQYGKDVAGTIRFFTTSFSLSHQFDACACIYVDLGEFQGGTLTFALETCNGGHYVGVFDKEDDGDDEYLEGVFQTEQGIALTETIRLYRSGGKDRIDEEEMNLGCYAE